MTPLVKQVCLKTSKRYLCSEEMGELYEEKKNTWKLEKRLRSPKSGKKIVYWHVTLCNTMNIHDIFFQWMNISMDNTVIFLKMKKWKRLFALDSFLDLNVSGGLGIFDLFKVFFCLFVFKSFQKVCRFCIVYISDLKVKPLKEIHWKLKS